MSRLNGCTALTHTRVGRGLMLLVMTIGVSGCAVLGLQAPWSDGDSPDYSLIASNLVNSLSQFPHLNPMMATVQVLKPSTAFGKQVHQKLHERGYKVETVASAKGMNQVKPSIKRVPVDGGMQKLYSVSIGQISAERAFSVVDEKTVPVSDQVIRGIKKRKLTLNDDIFEISNDAYSVVEFKAYAGPDIDDMLAAAPAKRRLPGMSFGRKRNSAVKKNVYETLASNYNNVFTGYEDIEQSILVFPNDSLRLGDTNKQIIEQYVSRMDPDTDVLSVIGCSHGVTKINNGNSLLALGRANRVKEAFLFSGLEHDKILDEGCWAPQTFDEVMPRRGVVLTLKRQKKS